mgnify:CR=1 FL=1
MPTILARMMARLLVGAMGGFASAQDAHTPPAIPDVGCSACHTCDEPSSALPCLGPCPRTSPEAIARRLSHKPAPKVVILGELEDRYLPVPFDHKGHADMAAMTRGCVECHHYTPEGSKHPACKTCHEVSSTPLDIRKPGLKGAYHRQCLNCHREWSGETKCEVCHHSKTGPGRRTAVAAGPTPDDIVGRMHPPIPEPDTEIFRAQNGAQAGTQVIFYHKEHIHRFGLACVECHHEDNCSRCHHADRPHEPRTPTLAEHHQPCAHCHNTTTEDRCSRCHWEEGKPKPPRFDHAATSFPLKPYHERVVCRACHAATPFVKQDRACNSCHRAWTPTNFDHALTGQRLDDNHARLECESCHVDRAFERPPRCDQCHEPEEGVSFPAKRPGQAVPSTGK